MSENVRFYQHQMAERRAIGRLNRSLNHQLREILSVVADCERRWSLDDRMERRLGRD